MGLSVAAPALAWAPSSSPRSVRSTPTASCSPSPSSRRPRCPTPLSSPTTPPSPSTSWSRTPTSACALTTRPSTTSASAPSSSPPRPTVTSTPSARPVCPASPAASASRVSSTPTSASSVLTSSRSRAHPADVRRQEHDVCRRPASRPLPHLLRPLPWPHVHQGGRRADAQRPEQELLVLRRVDPEQHQVLRL